MVLPISVVIITKNESENISACLESIRWVNETIVVDDYSIDQTVEICREYTDKIYLRRFDTFAQQRNFGIKHANNDWILILDADEQVTPELAVEIQARVGTEKDVSGYFYRRKNFYLGKEIQHCGWAVTNNLRLFNIRQGRFDTDSAMMELFIPYGKIGTFQNPMLHYTYISITQHLTKLQLYTSLVARDFIRTGVTIAPYNLLKYGLFRPVGIFLRKYISQSGFLDGYAGLLISFFSALANFIAYAKVWEHYRTEKKVAEE